jgi:AcrR family transcriptional regulator
VTRDTVPVWDRPERGARGPAPERSRGQITDAAIAVADEEGLQAVSMRRVAALLGTGSASLYRYVSGRDDLVDLMVDALTGRIERPAPTGDWAADLVRLARAVKALHLRHRWLLDLPPDPARLGPNALDHLEHALALLAPAPAGDRTRLEVIGVTTALAVQFAREEDIATRAPARHAAQAAYLARAATDGTRPRLAAALADQTPHPHDDRTTLFDHVLHRTITALIA